MRIAQGKSPILLTIPLLGHDLAGNTFWEFKDVVNASRYRRIVKFDPKTHYGDVQVTREFCRIPGGPWFATITPLAPNLQTSATRDIADCFLTR